MLLLSGWSASVLFAFYNQLVVIEEKRETVAQNLQWFRDAFYSFAACRKDG